jgi:hypothetical protein
MVQLNLKYSHDNENLYWNKEWISEYFNVDYVLVRDEESLLMPNNIFLTIKNIKTHLIELIDVVNNKSFLYDVVLPPLLKITHDKKIRGKIRDYILFIRYIDDIQRNKYNNILKPTKK